MAEIRTCRSTRSIIAKKSVDFVGCHKIHYKCCRITDLYFHSLRFQGQQVLWLVPGIIIMRPAVLNPHGFAT